jgi:hypothetical protein
MLLVLEGNKTSYLSKFKTKATNFPIFFVHTYERKIKKYLALLSVKYITF